MRSILRCAALICATLLVFTGCGRADPIAERLKERLEAIADVGRPDLSSDEVYEALERQMKVVAIPATAGENLANPAFPTRKTLATFYANNGQRLAWCDDSGRSQPWATTLLDALRRAAEHGLNAEYYALSRLELLEAQVGKGPLDDAAVARLADFDLLMTAAFFRYASDLATGRVHPNKVGSDWHTNPPELAALSKLHQAFRGDEVAGLLEAIPPPHVGYARLRAALGVLRSVEAAGGWPAIPTGPMLELGSSDPRVTVLRQRLSVPRVEGTFASDATFVAGDRFDAGLAEAVRRFQEQHGIEPDGKVGPTTLAELNVSVEQRILQVELNLERWRWIPRQLGDPHVLVNIPGFELEFVRDGGTVWRTRVVAGRAYTPTPVFSDQIVSVVANPPWHVPKSIALGEYLPELREDPAAFERRGLRLLEGSGEAAREVDPSTVDWHALEAGHFPYLLRQDPGPRNALGRVKFHLTNDFSIYLHDTPSRSLFAQSDRDLSHGCIRVESPLDLATQLLADSSPDLLREALARPQERHLSVDPPVSIHLVYLTAWVDDANALRFSPDVYGFDGPQRAALDRVASWVTGGPAAGAK